MAGYSLAAQCGSEIIATCFTICECCLAAGTACICVPCGAIVLDPTLGARQPLMSCCSLCLGAADLGESIIANELLPKTKVGLEGMASAE